jgi:hypothetical protein
MDYLTYIDLILDKNRENKDLARFDPKGEASRELIKYLKTTLKLIN